MAIPHRISFQSKFFFERFRHRTKSAAILGHGIPPLALGPRCYIVSAQELICGRERDSIQGQEREIEDSFNRVFIGSTWTNNNRLY